MVHYPIRSKPISICVLGDIGVGKSSLILQFVQYHFPEDYDPYIEDTYRREYQVQGQDCIFEILDTAGIEEYSETRENQIAAADAIILCYKITSKESSDLVTILHQQILRCREQIPPIILVGTMSDLEDQRQLSYEEGESLAHQLNIGIFFECSAKMRINVDECFIKTAEEVLAIKKFPEISDLSDDANESDVEGTSTSPIAGTAAIATGSTSTSALNRPGSNTKNSQQERQASQHRHTQSNAL
ncbi:hypothetical protein PACTADRAFT_48585, partial [Pachysolen tannophilus NRRL Y-2460]